MIYAKYTSNYQELSLAQRIAERIFGQREDLQAQFHNSNNNCLLLYEDDIPAGFGLIHVLGGLPEITAIGVLPKFRKQQYGDFILRTLTEHAFYYYKPDRVCAYSFPSVGGFFEQAGYHKSNAMKEQLGQYCYLYFIKPNGLIHKCTGCDECAYRDQCHGIHK